MPASRRTPWLICYDIGDPTRLGKIHKAVRRHATPFQYSVYHAHATRREIMDRFGALEAIIDPRRDDLRAYPLLNGAAPVVYGSSLLAPGILLLDGDRCTMCTVDTGDRHEREG